jgi:hypothetical protein
MDERTCTCCKEVKSNDDFYKTKKIHNTCKSCQKQYNINSNNTFKGFLKKLIRAAKNNAKKRTGERKIVSITYEDLCEIWEKQNGLCYYSYIKMITNTKSDWQCSLERLNQELGYIKENIVLCTLEFNHSTQWSHIKIKELFKISIIKDDEYKNANFNITPVIKTWNKQISEIINDIKHNQCLSCKIMKPFTEFYKRNYYCKLCADINRKKDNEKPRGFIFHLLQESKVSTNFRLKTKTKQERDLTYDINFDFLVELYYQQKGRCAYSGVKLTFGSYKDKSWIGSIERINPLKGYTKDNVCLIAFEFNTRDGTALSDPENVKGSSAWSREKFKYFEENYYKCNDGLWLEYLTIKE